MRLLHQDQFSDEELQKFKSILQRNCIDNMRVMINGCLDNGIFISNDNQPAMDIVLSAGSSLTPQVSQAITLLWKDQGIQEMYSRASELPRLGCQSDYYFDNANRFADASFVPTEADVVRAKIKTTGIKETQFTAGNLEFNMVDVGGQRTERRKWFHCFENVTAVIFLASLDAYDLTLEEDGKTNRMSESLKLFNEITASHWFKETSFILFLNKSDIFKQKIATSDINLYHNAYTGGKDFASAIKFIGDLYKSKFAQNNKKLFDPYVTCAVDPTSIRHVFDAVKKLLLKDTIDKMMPYGATDLV